MARVTEPRNEYMLVLLRCFVHAFIKSQFYTKPRRAPAKTDLSGQVAIVTGGITGLAYHCASHPLSLKLSHLILTVRSPEEGECAASKLRADYPTAKILIWSLEIVSYSTIRAFCRRVDNNLPQLDVAILNAGVLSTFLLAILMLPICKNKAPRGNRGRLTIVSSGTALVAKLPNRDKRPLLASFDDVNVQPWNSVERHFSSKMLGHLFFVQMLEYLNSDDVIVNLAERGMRKGSELHRGARGFAAVFLNTVKALAGRRPENGVWAYVDAAVVKGNESHGCFLMDWETHPFTRLAYLLEGQPTMDALWEETLGQI
ncbi:uncharacterized protein BDW43DRAFT_296960 [Aspergillus alliaceus]|uniref:uncharacterized protein n=1 Tax=Petromyces alliaceus TaxID=209559 RepID=UPI0012A3D584|nr:uncharacterized protein BDW43DRAFT_296960 [Aspergillus alliaceus]KAB8237974.1 hypothetical protein BDW43DRAFT_296960 [Aspergillus alliaceus]